jgi:hypothetical protein
MHIKYNIVFTVYLTMKTSKQSQIMSFCISQSFATYNKTQHFTILAHPHPPFPPNFYTNTCNISLWFANIVYTSTSPGLVSISSSGFGVSIMEVVVFVMTESLLSLTLFVCPTPFISKTDNTTYMI